MQRTLISSTHCCSVCFQKDFSLLCFAGSRITNTRIYDRVLGKIGTGLYFWVVRFARLKKGNTGCIAKFWLLNLRKLTIILCLPELERDEFNVSDFRGK